MGQSFPESDGKRIVLALITMINENRAYLSEIDGAIGDGDHGINMDKGFSLAGKRLESRNVGLSASLKELGSVLVDEIGGSMGPLYGTFFKRMARVTMGTEYINRDIVELMLSSAYEGITTIGTAKVGDKTLVDTLDPALMALREAIQENKGFSECLDAMTKGAEKGWLSTKDLVAKVGRASRLGERSRGVLDAGATSCFLILKTMALEMKELTK